jgi:hypothetical protein
LGKIGQAAKAAIPALIETAMMDKEHGLAAEALGRIGAEAKAAVPTLVAMLHQSPAQARIRIALSLPFFPIFSLTFAVRRLTMPARWADHRTGIPGIHGSADGTEPRGRGEADICRALPSVSHFSRSFTFRYRIKRAGQTGPARFPQILTTMARCNE